MAIERYYKQMAQPDSVERYFALKAKGKEILSQSSAVRTGQVVPEDIDLAKQVMIEGAKLAPPVQASYWEHITIAPEMGRRVASATTAKGVDTNPDEIEFMLWLHELGRIAEPPSYFSESLIGDRLLTEFGIPDHLKDKLDSMYDYIKVKETLSTITDPQEKERVIQNYFDSLTPEQRIAKLVDNLGKRDPEGRLFDFTLFKHYLDAQEQRYSKEPPWRPSMRWANQYRTRESLQVTLVANVLGWLNDNGVDFSQIYESMTDYGPRFVILVRHGELDLLPIVHNLDEVHEQYGVPKVHTSEEGKQQMREVAEIIKNRKFRVSRIIPSNQIRAVESASALAEPLGLDIKTGDVRFRDVSAPWVVAQKITWEQYKNMEGDHYSQGEEHETPDQIIERVNPAFWNVVSDLGPGETAIVVSHGDALAWEINHLNGIKPDQKNIRESMYPPKGSATLVITDPKNNEGIYATLPLAGWGDKSKIY